MDSSCYLSYALSESLHDRELGVQEKFRKQCCKKMMGEGQHLEVMVCSPGDEPEGCLLNTLFTIAGVTGERSKSRASSPEGGYITSLTHSGRPEYLTSSSAQPAK